MSVQRLKRRDGGFSLLLLSVWMIGLGLAVAVLLALLPNRSEQIHIENTIRTMDDAQHNVLGFVVENYRLPEPDTDTPAAATYGFENANANSGALPFRSMELPVAAVDQVSLPLRYAPYRNGPGADLAAATSLYVPALPALNGDYSCAVVPSSPINLLDFCKALDNADIAGNLPAFANTDGINAAYVLVSGGLEDADGDEADGSLDGANDDGDVSYEDPARGREKGYDDIVRPVPFAALQRELSCDALIGSLDLLVVTADDSKNMADSAQVAKLQADVGLALNSFGLALSAFALTNSILSTVAATSEAVQACINAVASLGVLTAGCVAATAAAVAAGIASVAAAIELGVSLATLGVAIANQIEAVRINNALHLHVCDVFLDVVNADLRGGLL